VKRTASLFAALFSLVWFTGAGWLPLARSFASFQGPVDIVTTNPLWCFSTRACSAALRGNAVMNVCDTTTGSEVGCTDILSSVVTGAMVATTVGTITCPGSVKCGVKKWYDQNNSGVCGGSCDQIEGFATGSVLVANCHSSGNPCVSVVAGTNFFQSVGNVAVQAQPFTFSNAIWMTVSASVLLDDGNNTCMQTYEGNLNFVRSFCGGSNQDVTAADLSFHAFAGVFNGASSIEYVESTANTIAGVGTNSFGGHATKLQLGGTFATTSDIFEMVAWDTAISGANATSLCNNQNTFFVMGLTCH
jgi:hypothetical protein